MFVFARAVRSLKNPYTKHHEIDVIAAFSYKLSRFVLTEKCKAATNLINQNNFECTFQYKQI